ncbi:MAG: exonuclease domain-containing protein [Actinomycetota bacterium]|jgi:ATP-dependent DNA helicase DinG|nr:exonuclease domain-containing protein [Actinomycetota bacterium]
MKNEGLSRFLVPGTDPDIAAEYEAYARRAREAVFGFEDEVVFVDIETTGFDPSRDRVIEIAAAVARGPEITDRFSTLVDPGRPVPPEIVRLTGIDDSMLKGAPSAESAVSRLVEFVAGRDVIAHNVGFDRSFLEHVAGTAAFRGAWLDSLQLSLIGLPRLSSHRLGDLAEAFGSHTPTHRAGDDVEALAFVWRVILCGLEQLPPALLKYLSLLAPDTQWPVRSVLAHMAAQHKAGAFDLKQARAKRIGKERAETLPDADLVVCTCPPASEIMAEFSGDGLAGRMYPGFEERGEQARMAEAVVDAFTRGGHVAVEAGTGVGKSLAYLVPAARFAQHNGVGVGVATKTNSLLDQLVYSELPALCEAIADEGGEPLRYVALKGYDHYPCLRKVEQFASSLGDVAEEGDIGAVAALFAWSVQSSWGDLDATNIHWRRPLRSALSASVPDCTHKRCRFYPNLCYLHGARRRASSAHIVVTNHALLFRDVVAEGGILPPLRHWVIDEAHAAEAEARKQLSMTASRTELSVVLGAMRAGTRGGALENVRRAVRKQALDDPSTIFTLLAQMEETVSSAATLTDSLFEFVRDLGSQVADTGYDTRELRVTPQLRDTGAWGTVAGVGSSLAKRLQSIVDEGRTLMTRLEEIGPELGDARADLVGLLSRCAGQAEALVAVIDGEEDRFVYSVTIDKRPNNNIDRLAASLLDVGEILAEEFFPRTRSAIFTSATIATGDDFSHFARSIGLDRLGGESWVSLRLDSSYDFERQMAVFIPRDIEPPSARGGYMSQLEALIYDLHVEMGGSVLTLFTNRRDMDALYRAIGPRLRERGLGLLVQGRGTSAKRLRDEFVADERLSLFATKSFWEGFDAKGDTLRCVVVPKLPFGPVNDPLLEERKERDGRWWEHYYLPEAIIELKQAAGRLIRSSTDEGCLVLADTRVIGAKTYGQRFLSSLPVRDIEIMDSQAVAAEVGRRFGRQPE